MSIIKPRWSAYLVLGIATLMICSCDRSVDDSIPVQHKKGNEPASKKTALISDFEAAVLIDSSSIVIYPLSLIAAIDQEEQTKRYSSYEKNGGPYWNIAFYDTKTGYSGLLHSGKVLRIVSYQKFKHLMIYTVTNTDYNGDGKLNREDPSYLFVSDLNGKNFKQISPDQMHIRHFQASDKTGVLLIQGVLDTNKDKLFEECDEIVPLVFDIQKDERARETFSAAFRLELNKIFKQLYTN